MGGGGSPFLPLCPLKVQNWRLCCEYRHEQSTAMQNFILKQRHFPIQLEKSCALFWCNTTQATCFQTFPPTWCLFWCSCSLFLLHAAPLLALVVLSLLQQNASCPKRTLEALSFWGQALHYGVSFYSTFLFTGWVHQRIFRDSWEVSVG